MLAYILLLFILLDIQAPKILIIIACLGLAFQTFKVIKISGEVWNESETEL